MKYTPVTSDVKIDIETPMLIMIPGGLVEWMLAAP